MRHYIIPNNFYSDLIKGIKSEITDDEGGGFKMNPALVKWDIRTQENEPVDWDSDIGEVYGEHLGHRREDLVRLREMGII